MVNGGPKFQRKNPRHRTLMPKRGDYYFIEPSEFLLNYRFLLGASSRTPSLFDPPLDKALTCATSFPLRSTPLASSFLLARWRSIRSGNSPLCFCCSYSFLYGLGLFSYGMVNVLYESHRLSQDTNRTEVSGLDSRRYFRTNHPSVQDQT